MQIRDPAVAGSFYPHDPNELRTNIYNLLADNTQSGTAPKGLIVPHAGYRYSGPIAASAYSLLEPVADDITKVVLLGPSHREEFDGLAVPSAKVFKTPLGTVPLDSDAINEILKMEQVAVLDSAHVHEHSLEVHLPFLQIILKQFTIIPLVVSDAEPEGVAEVLNTLWGGPETLIVVSSDLSHFHSYAEAESIDLQTSNAIQHFDCHLTAEQACGNTAINGLMVAAKKRNMQVSQIDLRNSGDTSGSKHKVVGYGAYGLQ